MTQGNGIELDLHLILTHNIGTYTQNVDFINYIGKNKIGVLISCSNTFELFSLAHKSDNMSRSHISRHGWNQKRNGFIFSSRELRPISEISFPVRHPCDITLLYSWKKYQEHQKLQCRIGLKIDPSPEDLNINFPVCAI